MPRSIKELSDLNKLVAQRYAIDFGEPCTKELLLEFLSPKLQETRRDFFERMLGHLKPDDLIGFLMYVTAPPVVEPQPMVKKSGRQKG